MPLDSQVQGLYSAPEDGIKLIFDTIFRSDYGKQIPTREYPRYFSPVVTHVVLKSDERFFFLLGPGAVLDAVVEVVVVPFTALFARATSQLELLSHDLRNLGPSSKPPLDYKHLQCSIFLNNG